MECGSFKLCKWIAVPLSWAPHRGLNGRMDGFIDVNSHLIGNGIEWKLSNKGLIWRYKSLDAVKPKSLDTEHSKSILVNRVFKALLTFKQFSVGNNLEDFEVGKPTLKENQVKIFLEEDYFLF